MKTAIASTGDGEELDGAGLHAARCPVPRRRSACGNRAAAARGGDLHLNLLADVVRASARQRRAATCRAFRPGAWERACPGTAQKLDASVFVKYAGRQYARGRAGNTDGGVHQRGRAGWRSGRGTSIRGSSSRSWGATSPTAVQRNAVALNKDEVIMPGRDIRLMIRARSTDSPRVTAATRGPHGGGVFLYPRFHDTFEPGGVMKTAHRLQAGFARQSLLRLALAAAVASTVLCACMQKGGGAAQAVAAQRPNILFILADDLGYADLGVFGSEIPTPNLDALREGGMLLTDFYAGMTCSPTRAMLMSGTDNHLAGLGVMGAPTRDGPEGPARLRGLPELPRGLARRPHDRRRLQHLHDRQVAPRRRRRDRSACARLQALVRLARRRGAPGRLGLARPAARQATATATRSCTWATTGTPRATTRRR